jgi:hypothetical protein
MGLCRYKINRLCCKEFYVACHISINTVRETLTSRDNLRQNREATTNAQTYCKSCFKPFIRRGNRICPSSLHRKGKHAHSDLVYPLHPLYDLLRFRRPLGFWRTISTGILICLCVQVVYPVLSVLFYPILY